MDRFPIVGIGASAGGLEAFTRLLEHLPLDAGLGIVLVQHLDPEHESALCQILSRVTRLAVEEIVDGQRVEPNRVYVIPRDTTLSIVRGVLRLQPRERARVPHRPIDTFFEALAQDCGERAIGVVLSGTGSDGTIGLEAIKAEGGITFAQDSSARHDSMPRSAMAAGCVDLMLSPAEIARELVRIAGHPYVALSPAGAGHAGDAVAKADEDGLRGELDRAEATAHDDEPTPLPSGGHVQEEPALLDRSAAPSSPDSPEALAAQGGAPDPDDGYKRILALLHSHSGVDFSLYKSTTIRRRIARRMILTKHDTPLNYAAYLRGNGKELDALYSDVLISVTSFFRNPETFDVLQQTVLPALLDIRSDDPLRCWVLGCSTGQEAYSIAMAFVEVAENAPHTRRLQIFATDLNESLLDKARHGVYARSLEQDISPERLRRFFVEEEGGYRVVKSLREMVVFARQNLIADPPFSRMDMISCRNLLIYLEPILQQKAMPTFHYALKPTGFLLLGASESIGTFTDLFEPLDKKHKVYTRKPVSTPAVYLAATRSRPADSGARAMLPMRSVARYEVSDEFRGSELTAQREADRVTVNQFAPPGVLVDAQLQILQFRGPTGAFLEPPAGKASFDVLKMAREGLMLPLRAAIEEARRDSKSVRRDNVQIRQDGSTRTVTLDVVPLKNLREPCFLILFDDARGPSRVRATSSRTPVIGKRQEPGRITELETELTETRDFLMSVQEQHEAANEELQAANEEIQSSNEELQSVNEELETSKEELESANEELITVNEEMSHRNVELNRLNADLLNLQLATGLAIILVGRDLTVRRFSPQAQKQFDLLPTDVGRPIGHLRHHLVQDSTSQPVDLEHLAADVVGSLTELDQQVRDSSGRWFSLRVRPYLTLDNRVDGAALVWFDIDALKRTETGALAARDFAENTIATVREPLLVVDRHFRIESANSAFYRVFRLTPAQSVGESLLELRRWHWDAERVHGLLQDAFSGNAPVEDVAVTYTTEAGDLRQLQFTARRIMDPAGTRERVLLVIDDVTERVRAGEAMAHLAAIVTSSEDAIISKSLDGIIVTWNRAAERLFRYAEWEVIGKSASQLVPEDRRSEEPEILGRIRQGEVIEHFETLRRRKDGSTLPISLTMSPLLDADSRVAGISMVARDITDRKAGEEQLARQVAQFEALLNQSPFGVFLVDADLRLQHMSGLARDMLTDVPALPGSGLDVFGCLWPQFDREAVKQRFKETLATGERYVAPADAEAHPERETSIFYDWQISRIAMPDGRYGVVCFFQDVSARIRSQRQIIELVTALQNGDRLKDEFLAMLAHELRGPLAPLGNMLEVLKRARGNADVLDTVHDSMQRQVRQLTRLVDDLLDINRIKRGQIELRRERIDLVPVLRQAIATCQSVCERAGHALTVSIPPEPLWVSGDPARLAQVFGNLLNNACKYTVPPGRIDLAVAIEGGEVVVTVQDNGIGIAADMLSSIFDMFVQADDARERAQGGLGLGLALARRLVELHEGSLHVHSEGPGRGSEFRVRLARLDLRAPLPPPSDAAAAATPTPPLRILVVDDNHDSADTLAMLLGMDGHELQVAYDGLEAVVAAGQFRPDVVLLDIGLPRMNGHDVCRRIREQPWGRTMRLIALSGWTQEEDRRKSWDAGFDEHLAKPPSYPHLRQLLDAAAAAKHDHGRKDPSVQDE